MKLRDQLYNLIKQGEVVCKHPLKECYSIDEVMIYGPFKTDLMMANVALAKNSIPMIQHYIEKLKLHLEVPNATTQEEDNG